MKAIKQDTLKTILNAQNEPCVSLYMPCYQGVPEREKNRIRLKNLLKEARSQLVDSARLDDETVEALLAPAVALQEQGFSDAFTEDGLAIFLGPDFSWTFSLPLSFEPQVIVSRRFHIKPILPLFTNNTSFNLLTLSREEARLYRGTRFGLEEVDLTGFPVRLEEITELEDEERDTQFHTSTQPSGPDGERQAIYHGTEEDRLEQSRLRRYFRLADERLKTHLGGTQRPLILAGVDELFPIYREANRYPHLVDAGIAGNPESLSAEELHQRAWAILQPFVEGDKTQALNAYRQLTDTDRVSVELGEILAAARHGRVSILMAARGQHRWGSLNTEDGVVTSNGETGGYNAVDLLDIAVAETLMNGGKAYLLDPEKMPAKTPVAAVYRY